MDETTGLPELPEDHYWDVRETDFRYPSLATRADQIERRFTVAIWMSYKKKSMVRKHWWSGYKEEWYEASQPVWFGYMPELTAETLRAKAEEVKAQLDAHTAHRHLLGSYPPKKLES